MQTITKHPTLTAEDIGNIWTGAEAWAVAWEVTEGIRAALAAAVPSLHATALAQVRLQALQEVLAQIAVQRPDLEADLLEAAGKSTYGVRLRGDVEIIIDCLRRATF